MPIKIQTKDEEILDSVKEKLLNAFDSVKNLTTDNFEDQEVLMAFRRIDSYSKGCLLIFGKYAFIFEKDHNETTVEITDLHHIKFSPIINIGTDNTNLEDCWEVAEDAYNHYVDLVDELYPVTQIDVIEVTDPSKIEIMKTLKRINL